MPQRIYTNFSGGVNKQIGPVVLDAGGAEALALCEDSFNWECSEAGLIKRPGYDADLAAALSGTPVITGDFEFIDTSGNRDRLVCAGTKIFTVSGGVATEVLTGQTSGAYYQTVEWDDGAGTNILIFMNGVDDMVYWDGSTMTTMTPTDPDTILDGATPSFACVFRGRIFYSGDPDMIHRVYTPRPGTFDNFDNTDGTVDAFDVDAGFGGRITGLKALTNNFLTIYKERAIRRLSGTSPFGSIGTEPFEITPVTDQFGCIAPRTLVGNEVEHYFFAEDGLRQLRPIETYGDIDPQQPTYPVQSVINALNFSAITDACAVFDKTSKQIWLAVPDGASTTNNKLINFDVITRTVDFRTNGDIKASTLSYINRAVCHGDYVGQIYTHGIVNSNNGANITAEWTGKFIAHNGIGTMKTYRKVMFFADADSGGDVIVQWTILREDETNALSETQTINSANVWDVGLWDVALWATGANKVLALKNLGKGNCIAFKFTNVSSTQRVKIRQVDMYYDIFGTHRG
jgi:hypothetical protein